MLRNIEIKAVYNSEEDNILEDFYIPLLKNSVSYDRAVGYFDAKMLVSSAQGIGAFLEQDGHMRLICGATLTENEYAAISQGYDNRNLVKRIETDFESIVRSDTSDLFKNQLNALTWLIEQGRLDVKIALRKYGIHHQKIGIFKDKYDDFVVFQGSANETNNALLPFNFETINVFKSWESGLQDHYEPHINTFKALWSNQYQNTLVLNISDITKRVLKSTIGQVERPSLSDEVELWQKYVDKHSSLSSQLRKPHIPKKLGGREFKIYDHQRAALNSWKNNGYRGLFELATGSGKTITAIYGAMKVYEARKKLFCVIAVPYQSLADQWADNLSLFGIDPIVCYGGESNWRDALSEAVLLFNTGVIKVSFAVVVDATLSGNLLFKKLMSDIAPELEGYFLFVGDECHHHGTDKTYEALPKNAQLRIGLSATPDKFDDDEKDQDNVKKYYGRTIAEYTLKDALDQEVLTPYEYYLISVELAPEETDDYVALTKRINKLIAMSLGKKEKFKDNDQLNVLLSQRSRIINGTQNKHLALRNLLEDMKPIYNSLFYCAEGQVEYGDAIDEEEGLKQIELVSSILHDYGWRSCQFTANEKKKQRDRILEDFKDKKVHSLVAMKCLDEGVDIPACTTAFILSSSRKERQFIQRRGRILRKSDGKDKATIYDFFVTLPVETEEYDMARNLLKAEIRRINEFANLSLNPNDTYKTLKPYITKYDLDHFVD